MVIIKTNILSNSVWRQNTFSWPTTEPFKLFATKSPQLLHSDFESDFHAPSTPSIDHEIRRIINLRPIMLRPLSLSLHSGYTTQYWYRLLTLSRQYMWRGGGALASNKTREKDILAQYWRMFQYLHRTFVWFGKRFYCFFRLFGNLRLFSDRLNYIYMDGAGLAHNNHGKRHQTKRKYIYMMAVHVLLRSTNGALA